MSKRETINKTISVADFIHGGYEFGKLTNGDRYRFSIHGEAQNGHSWEFSINYVLPANEEDQETGGIIIGPNRDGDGKVDSEDIDDDGDGLIEIETAAELDAVRYQLDGTGRA